jgi:predicted RNA-binding protein YlxR (DUF448 family)
MVDPTDRLGRRPVHVPERTCVGCRTKAPRSVLMRIVAAQAGGSTLVAEPDLRLRRPGRGAWLHPSPDCLDLAIRRRAFPRALRVPGPLDTGALLAAVGARTQAHEGEHEQDDQVAPARVRRRTEPEAGHHADEHPMSAQQ